MSMRVPCRLAATLTATSADGDRSGQVVRVVVLTAEGVAQGVDGVPLESESYVGIDAGGDADVSVTQKLLDHDEIDALLQEQGWRSSDVGRGSGCVGVRPVRGSGGSGV